MQIKTTIKYHVVSIRMSVIKKDRRQRDNTITEIKNTLKEISSRISEAEEQIK